MLVSLLHECHSWDMNYHSKPIDVTCGILVICIPQTLIFYVVCFGPLRVSFCCVFFDLRRPTSHWCLEFFSDCNNETRSISDDGCSCKIRQIIRDLLGKLMLITRCCKLSSPCNITSNFNRVLIWFPLLCIFFHFV